MAGRRGGKWHNETVDWFRFILLPELRAKQDSRESGGTVWGMCDAPWLGCGIPDARSPDAAFLDDAGDVVLVEVGDMRPVDKWPQWAVLQVYKDGGWALVGPPNGLSNYILSIMREMNAQFGHVTGGR